MPGWFGKESDWNDARRLETALGRVRGGGAGHDPVTLDENADNILVIPGIDDEPQQIGLVEQDAFTFFAGPNAAGPAAIPDFRLIVTGDIVGALPFAVPALTLGTANAAGVADTIIRTDATILAFDVTLPEAIVAGGAGAVGVATVTARRDHVYPAPATWPATAHNLLSATHGDTVVNTVARGSLVFGNADADWDELTHPGVGYALTTDADDVVWDQTPTWSGGHTWDDGAGDSPMLALVGGSNDDTGYIYLVDDAAAGNSDLGVRLCAADADSHFSIQSNAPAEVAYIDAAGNADFSAHLAVGAAASVDTARIVNVSEATTLVAGTFIGQAISTAFSPGAGYATSVYGLYLGVNLTTAQTRAGGGMYGIFGQAIVDNGVDARDAVLTGGQFVVDCQDAGVGGGVGVLVGVGLDTYTPYVDTGNCFLGYGLRVNQGIVGAGSITTLYGIYMDAITAGNTNYAIYTNAGQVRVGDDINIAAAGKGIIHVDGVAAGYILLADGTRYIPAKATATLPIAPAAQGDMLIADATPEWSILTLGAGAGYALVSTATTAEWDQTPVWTGNHTWDDGVGDSPALALVGGSNDDTGYIYLDDDAAAGNSDLAVRLCAADADSHFSIQSNAPAEVAYIDAAGNADFSAHLAVGAAASVDATRIVNVSEATTLAAGTFIGQAISCAFSPAGAYTTSVYGLYFGVNLTTAQTRAGGGMYGIFGQAIVDNGIDARDAVLTGGMFAIDCQDAGVGGGVGVLVGVGLDTYTPYVDTGNCFLGYGLRVNQGTVGAGSIVALYGIYMDAITAGNTNYAIYSAGGNSYHAGDFSIGGTVAPAGQLHVDQSAGAGAQPVAFLDQGDVSEQHIVCSINGTDVDFPAIIELDVTGAPTLGWVEAADQLTWNKHLSLTAGDLYLASGFGLIYADSVAVGKVPVADGTRYVPGDVTTAIITDLA